MRFLIFSGVVGVTFGLLLLCAPEIVLDMNNRWNRMILLCDEKILKYRAAAGIFLLCAGLYTFFGIFRLMFKYGINIM